MAKIVSDRATSGPLWSDQLAVKNHALDQSTTLRGYFHAALACRAAIWCACPTHYAEEPTMSRHLRPLLMPLRQRDSGQHQ